MLPHLDAKVHYGQGEAQNDQHKTQPQDTLLITPTTQGTFTLPNSGITLEIAYATVHAPTRLSAIHDSGGVALQATNTGGAALNRFEMPVIVHHGDGTTLTGWPGPLNALDHARWLVIFDAHGIYALPADGPAPEAVIYLGPLEHYAPDLIRHDLDWDAISIEPLRSRQITITDGGKTIALSTAAHAARYRDRFIPEDLGNPGGFMLLGWTYANDLPDLARALRGTIPGDSDIPLPGEQNAPLNLSLPFDCTSDWAISWGYHHSTPQNRFAVDFAPLTPGEQPVYAAHAGTLVLKRFGTADHMIDTGLAARVVAEDAITSTVYGHLAVPGTLERWKLEEANLPDFEWVEIGPVAQGEMIGIMGRTGYATGAHIHVALWSWDQSLYQPVPFGPLVDRTAFVRGQTIPAARRGSCDIYHW